MVKSLPAIPRDPGSIPGWEDPWRRKRQPTPVFLPGESHGQRSLAGYNLWGRKSPTRLKQLSSSSRYADDTAPIAEGEELKSSLMKVKEESEKIDLKLNI